MSNFISKHISMPIGRKNKSQKFSLNTHHETTTDFFKQKPIWCQELVPGDKFNLSVSNEVRLSPLAAPTFGSYEIHNRCFFVPYRTVFPDWNSFITNVPSDVSGTWPTTVPYVNNAELVWNFLHGGPSSNFYMSQITSGTPDVVLKYWTGSTWASQDYVFTAPGRAFFNVLCSLGYQINWYHDPSDTGFTDPTHNDLREMSLLPLLCYFKVIADYYVPSEYVNYYLSHITSFNDISDIDTYSLWPLLGYTMYYGSDYLTAAWNNPNSPNSFAGASQSVNVYDNTQPGTPTSDKSMVSTNYIGTPVLVRANQGSTIPSSISQYILDSLQRVTNYMRRNQMSGYRVLDRYLAKYGYTLESARLNRSILVGSDTIPFSISAVVSQTSNAGQTGGSYLGDLAGYSIGRSNGKFHFDNTGSSGEFGLMLIVSSCIPQTGYYQGTRRYLQHIRRLNFFNSEFDNLGVDAIRNDEVYSCYGLGYQSGSSYLPTVLPTMTDTFGFSPRYTGDYKVGYDSLTGDFRFASRNAGFDSYHTFRNVYDPDNRIDTYPVLSQQFKVGDQQYDRIFQYTGQDYDHFIHDINVFCEAYRPMVSITDSLLPEEDEEHNEKVSIQLNGTQLN